MARWITLTIACDDFDHIRSLMDGTVKPQGIDLVFSTELTNPERPYGAGNRHPLHPRARDDCCAAAVEAPSAPRLTAPAGTM
jgi:hypothetical protein